MKCPKCNGEMEEGITADTSGNYGQDVSKWAKGRSFMGIYLKDPKVIKSFRCKKCGYLENYAK